MKKYFEPFQMIRQGSYRTLAFIQLIALLTIWQLRASGLIPVPTAIGRELVHQFSGTLLWHHLIISLGLTLKALAVSLVTALLICYLSVIPFFRGLAQLLVQLRYLTLTGLIFIFTLLTSDGGQLKLSLLVMGMVPFFVTSFLQVIRDIPADELDLATTLGFSRWRTLHEVIIIGKADQVLEILRQNFAIAWLMITLVEGLSMSEGGIGTLLIKFNKYNDLTRVLTMQAILFGLGLLFDALLGYIRLWLFPYTRKK